ncbi:hypothetical protein [Burkholderia sp. Bp9140]|uniref:hypothetical protein n=1 Tax=Burkholderia sp. Bp9140 TaxID=2184572 RepID=UPI000F561AF0|nr:hypothetical protein [Burkholderia sp. Bp9140]
MAHPSELGAFRLSSPPGSRPTSAHIDSQAKSAPTTPDPAGTNEPTGETVKRYAPPPGPPPHQLHANPSGQPPQQRYDPPPGPPPQWSESNGAHRYDPPPGPPPGFHAHYPNAPFEPLLQTTSPPSEVAPTRRPADRHQMLRRAPQFTNMAGQFADFILSTVNAVLQIMVKAAHKLEELSRK